MKAGDAEYLEFISTEARSYFEKHGIRHLILVHSPVGIIGAYSDFQEAIEVYDRIEAKGNSCITWFKPETDFISINRFKVIE